MEKDTIRNAVSVITNRNLEFQSSEPNEVTYAAMKVAEIGEDMYGPFDCVEELMEALND